MRRRSSRSCPGPGRRPAAGRGTSPPCCPPPPRPRRSALRSVRSAHLVVVPVEVLALERVQELLAAADDPELGDHEDVGRELDDLVLHEGVEAGDHRDDADQRRHADDDAEQREEAAQRVGARSAAQRLAAAAPRADIARLSPRRLAPPSFFFGFSSFTASPCLSVRSALKGPVMIVSPPFRPETTSIDSSPRRPVLIGLEARLAVLHQVDALLVARRARLAAPAPGFRSMSRTTRAWMRHDQRLRRGSR